VSLAPTQQPRRRSLTWPLCGLAVFVAAAVWAAAALGFGTYGFGGQQYEHLRITRAALDCHGRDSGGGCFETESIAQLAGREPERGVSGWVGAVGAPDKDQIQTPAAHCDNADFLSGYYAEEMRRRRNERLAACWTHLRNHFWAGVRAAEGLLDKKGRIIASEVDIDADCTYFVSVTGRVKCDVIEHFGRLLHGVQDFYSHSNWADQADPDRPVSPLNPPGLNRFVPAPFLDLRRRDMGTFPDELTTGCFQDGCADRITHDTLNKDNGDIAPLLGGGDSPRTPRGKIASAWRLGSRSRTRGGGGAISWRRSASATGRSGAS
jgi:hypothetical protein